jgi:hypothetical protein
MLWISTSTSSQDIDQATLFVSLSVFDPFQIILTQRLQNVSMVDTTRNEVIGEPLKTWPVWLTGAPGGDEGILRSSS